MARLIAVVALLFASSVELVSSFCQASNRQSTFIRRSLDMVHFNENVNAFDAVLYDMPVSNNGARVRMLLKAKGLFGKEGGCNIVIRCIYYSCLSYSATYIAIGAYMCSHLLNFRPPSDIGGLKSDEYLKLNPQGKMPLLVTERGLPIPESDTICQYIVERYKEYGPSFSAIHHDLKALDRHLIRLHDTYLLPIQGCMYKAPGTVFGSFGTDRKAALSEFLKQLRIIEEYLVLYDRNNANRKYKLKSQFEKEECNYLCGAEIQLADCTLYPTIVFAKYMLPQFFDVPKDAILGPNLQKWWCYMTDQNDIAKETKQEIENTLIQWRQNGRWDPIIAEIRNA